MKMPNGLFNYAVTFGARIEIPCSLEDRQCVKCHRTFSPGFAGQKHCQQCLDANRLTLKQVGSDKLPKRKKSGPKPQAENIARGQYWDKTWSPWIGCTPCSPGCEHCWARRQEDTRLRHLCRCGEERPCVEPYFWRGPVYQGGEMMCEPTRWRKPQVIFAGFRTDLFHAELDEYDTGSWVQTIRDAQQHTYIVVTKRAAIAAERLATRKPIANAIILATVCNQQEADEKLPHLLAVARLGWNTGISIEPMLGPIDIDGALWEPVALSEIPGHALNDGCSSGVKKVGAIRWVIVGGESGKDARPMHPDWVRTIRDQCAAASVPFWYKQNWGKDRKNRVLDGRTHEEWWE